MKFFCSFSPSFNSLLLFLFVQQAPRCNQYGQPMSTSIQISHTNANGMTRNHQSLNGKNTSLCLVDLPSSQSECEMYFICGFSFHFHTFYLPILVSEMINLNSMSCFDIHRLNNECIENTDKSWTAKSTEKTC